MVSLNTILAIGGIGAAYLIYKNFGGASGIGSSIGSAIGSFGTGITQGFNRFGNLVETPQSNAQNPAERITEQLDLGDYVIPTQEVSDPLAKPSAFEKSALTFAGLEQQYNTAARIDLTTGERKSSYGVQPLDFTFDGSGGINTGRVGLSDATLQAQQELSKKYGIPTFDTAGNLSTFAGAATTRTQGKNVVYNPYPDYSNPNFEV
jgi:hypothetical protein